MSRPIQTPGPSNQLVDRYAIKGGLALKLDEVVSPVEVILPRPRRVARGSVRVAAGGAGFISESSLINPLPFGPTIEDTSIHILEISISTQTTTTFLVVRTTAGVVGVTTLTTKSFIDFPRGLSPDGVIALKNDAVATAGTTIWRAAISANDPFVINFRDHPLILDGTVPGGNGIMVRNLTADIAHTVNFLWSEPPDQI